MNVRCARGGVAVLLLVAAAAAQQVPTLELGTLGAKAEVDRHWRPRKVDEYRDGDQFDATVRGGLFGSDKEAYVVVRELKLLLEGEADYRRALDRLAWGGTGGAITVQQRDGFVHVARTFEKQGDDVTSAGRADLLVQNGLCYLVLVWAAREHRARVDAVADQLADGFSFPPADSAWAQQCAATTRTVALAGGQLQLDAAPALWQEQADDSYALRLCTIERAHSVTLHATRAATASMAVMRETQALQSWYAGLVSHAPQPRRIGDRDCLEVAFVAGAETLTTLVVPLDHGEFAMLRYRAPGPADAPRPTRDAIFQSVRFTPGSQPLDLPPAPPPAQRERDSRLVAFVAANESRPGVNTYGARLVQTLADGSHVVVSWNNTFHLQRDEVVELHKAAGVRTTGALFWNGAWWTWRGDTWQPREAKAAADVDGEAAASHAPPPFVTVAVGGGRLWQWRPRGAPDYGLGAAVGGGQLVGIDADGTEHAVAPLDDCEVESLAANDAGDVLLVGHRRGPFDTERREPAAWLVHDGAARPLAGWRHVRVAAPAPQGFLLAGRPDGEPDGIWWLTGDGAPELLVSGAWLTPLGLRDEALEFLCNFGDASRLVRASLTACRRDGRLCQPFCVEDLDAIGAQLLAAHQAPREREQLDALLTALEAMARERRGVGFGGGRDDLQALIDVGTGNGWSSAAVPARVVLALAVVQRALAHGGEWVVPPRAAWSDWTLHHEHVPASPFAVAGLLPSLIHDEFGDGRSASVWRLEEDRKGRRLLIGVEPASLAAELAATRPEGLEHAVADGDVAAVVAAFDAAPLNVSLREAVYVQLAARAEPDALLAVAGRQAARDDVAAVDLVAWFGVRVAQLAAADRDAQRALFEELLAALRRFPGELRLCLLLGDVARLAFPDEPQKARQCYLRVLQVYGPVRDRAERALRELDRK